MRIQKSSPPGAPSGIILYALNSISNMSPVVTVSRLGESTWLLVKRANFEIQQVGV